MKREIEFLILKLHWQKLGYRVFGNANKFVVCRSKVKGKKC